jgi:HTH-type transcriptional regulator / antitoxin HigA
MLNMTRTGGNMTLTFDPTIYNNLLVETSPKVIETKEEYEGFLALAERLHFIENLTTEQQALYRLLVMLIEQYESENYPITQSKPHEILQHILESSGMRQVDLIGWLGSSGVVSEMVNGRRAISKTQAKLLGERFKVSPSLFI